VVGHMAPEAVAGGPIAAVRDNDLIELDLSKRELNLFLDEAEIKKRIKSFKPPDKDLPGLLRRYAASVGGADRGAVFTRS